MSKSSKKPDMRLKVLYVTPTKSEIVPLKWEGGLVKLEGEGSCKVTRAHVFPKGAPFDAIWVQGQSEAVPVDKAAPVTSWELDSAADTDLLNQVHGLAKGHKTPKASWVGIGLQVAVLLGLVILGVVLMGTMDDLQALMHQLHGGPVSGGDTTTYRAGG